MSKDNVTVGFVGLGTMGARMAANVQRAGFKLLVYDLHRQAASHFLPMAPSGQTARVHSQPRPT